MRPNLFLLLHHIKLAYIELQFHEEEASTNGKITHFKLKIMGCPLKGGTYYVVKSDF